MFLLHDLRMEKEFEHVFSKVDPFDVATNECEFRKYRELIGLLHGRTFRRILELGSAEGVFTAMLAEIGGSVIGLDISRTACERARARCADRPNVRIVCGSLSRLRARSEHDLITASEVLYYLSRRRQGAHLLGACVRIERALVPGGLLLMSNWYDPAQPVTVDAERTIKRSCLEAGLIEEQEHFQICDRNGKTVHYCLLLFRKPGGAASPMPADSRRPLDP